MFSGPAEVFPGISRHCDKLPNLYMVIRPPHGSIQTNNYTQSDSLLRAVSPKLGSRAQHPACLLQKIQQIPLILVFCRGLIMPVTQIRWVWARKCRKHGGRWAPRTELEKHCLRPIHTLQMDMFLDLGEKARISAENPRMDEKKHKNAVRN